MKKILTMSLVLLAGVSLSACGSNSNQAKSNASLRAENESLKKADHENIVVRQMWLHENLEELLNHFTVVSFDNLAIEQLDVKRLMTDEEWEEA